MPDYRPNVALILRNASGEVLLCERSDWTGTWQFPQGGIQAGETPDEALTREVKEELGLSPDAYRVLTCRGPYRYLFPNGITKRGFHGQEQTYFLAELTGSSVTFDFGSQDPEFRAARWENPSQFRLSVVPPMKRDVYRAVFLDFFGVDPLD